MEEEGAGEAEPPETRVALSESAAPRRHPRRRAVAVTTAISAIIGKSSGGWWLLRLVRHALASPNRAVLQRRQGQEASQAAMSNKLDV